MKDGADGRMSRHEAMLKLKPYPRYKDSGVPWLGEMPAHWEMGTLRRRLQPYDGIKIGPFGSQLKLDYMIGSGYKVYGQANVIAADFVRGTKFVDEQKFNELSACAVRAGDLLLTMMGSTGRCALVPDGAEAGIMDSHLLRLRPNEASVVGRFAALVIDQAPYVKEQLVVAGKGSIMHGLNSGMVKNIIVVIPPVPEQSAIVRFLDYADRRIRRSISAKLKLITLLEEQKQAIIYRAVTRGLDSNVRLKPSGVEWLGDVPEHWKVWQVGHFARVGNGSTPSRSNGAYWSNDCYPWLNSASVNRNPITYADQFVTELALQECHLPRILPGSVLVAITGQGKTRGTAAILTIEATINQHIAYVTPRHSVVTAEYLQLIFVGAYRELRRISGDSGSTKGALTCADIAHFKVALPPLDEQAKIAAANSRDTQSVAMAIDRAHREISLLREYRTRLIADVVTGKLDVRAAAASLPDEPDELEAPDGTDTLSEHEQAVDVDLDVAPEVTEA